jgi:hypothetical protein
LSFDPISPGVNKPITERNYAKPTRLGKASDVKGFLGKPTMIKFLRLIFATSINQISNPQRELPSDLHA